MDIICALCGEPWSTQGLHYSHSDLEPEDFYRLVNGRDCPCCNDKDRGIGDQPDPEDVDQWRRSVARASEGVIDEWELDVPQCQFIFDQMHHKDVGLEELLDRLDAGEHELVAKEQIGWV